MRYQFEYKGQAASSQKPSSFSIDFLVEPESQPPTNIHVIIGRNGVGKTHLLNSMINSALFPSATEKNGVFAYSPDPQVATGLFANIISVTFSAFDSFAPVVKEDNVNSSTNYAYIGLQREKGPGNGTQSVPKTPTEMADEFANSAKKCLRSVRLNRWKRALEMLETDSSFKLMDISQLASVGEESEVISMLTGLFSLLSSGHKIVLLTITRLVEVVEERSLVLLDEPEAHLHPPLLSAFIRALSELLIDRNGVAIVATHSPVVLQEVPRRCVWKVRRNGNVMTAERPEIETFGENVGILTREIFGLEVTDSGFHKLLREKIEEFDSYEQVLQHFNYELGGEAKAILRTLMLRKTQTKG